MEENGMGWDGMGMRLNGMEWGCDGMEWNGMGCDGMEWNGMEWDVIRNKNQLIVDVTSERKEWTGGYTRNDICQDT